MSFLIFGHRGSPRRFPENTAASFEEALRSGADGFETDLRLLADNTAVLFHDHEINDADVETLSRADVRADLLDTLASFAGRCTMVLEVKRSKLSELGIQYPNQFTVLNIVPSPQTVTATGGVVIQSTDATTTTSQWPRGSL